MGMEGPSRERIEDPLKAEYIANRGDFFRSRAAVARQEGDKTHLDEKTGKETSETEAQYQDRYAEFSEQDAVLEFNRLENEIKEMHTSELSMKSRLMERELSRRHEAQK